MQKKYEENELISIIIPVYNSEKYLDKCISSALNQTYTNLEVIVINDGSTDNSLEICKKWKKRDSRIVLINKKNTGVSDSRNFGLEAARGKYIAFLDSDDYVENNMYEELISSMKNNNSDLSTCGISYVKDNTKEDWLYNYPELLDKHTFLDKFRKGGDFIVNKLMKKEIIGELRFCNEIRYAEDILFFYEYLDKIEKISSVNKVLYNYYVDNLSSLTHTVDSKDYIRKIEAGYYIGKILKKNNINDIYKGQANTVCNYVIHKKNIGKDFDYSKYESIVKEYMDDGLIFKVKGIKNKIKVFLAYYMKDVYWALKRIKDSI